MPDPDAPLLVQVSESNTLSDQQAADLAAVYRAAFGAPPYHEGEEAVRRFLTEQLPQHVARKGFRLAVATVDDRMVGFGYGYTGERGQWWSDRVVERLPAEITDEWVGGHFEFVELAVDPKVQGRGVGTALHDRLMDGLPHRKALLSTYSDDRPAPRLYRRLGWQILARNWDEGSDLYGIHLPKPGDSLQGARCGAPI